MSDVPDLKFTLSTNFSQLIADKENEEDYPATLHSEDPDFPFNNLSILVRTRGETRKKICDFPPLMLKMPEDSLAFHGLAPFDKIKLVTHCMDSEDYNQLVLKEYLNYKLFNLITDSSFRVQRAVVTYRDLDGILPETEKYAFLIEPDEEMAQRLGGVLDESDRPVNTVDANHYQKLVLFQYMVGNTDWNLGNRHNVRILVPPSGSPIPIPYDFDYSGLVNAPYASPHPMLPIKDVQERLFQWRGSQDNDFSNDVIFYQKKKSLFLHMCRLTTGLDQNQLTDVLAYLESFYEGIDTPEKISKAISFARGG